MTTASLRPAQASSCIRRATGIVPPFGYCQDGVTMTAAGPSGRRSTRRPAVVDRDVGRRCPEGLEDPLQVRAAGILEREDPPVAQPQSRSGRHGALRARGHDDLLGRGADGPRQPEIGGELGAQAGIAFRVAIGRGGCWVRDEIAPGARQQALPERHREQVEPRRAGAEVVPRLAARPAEERAAWPGRPGSAGAPRRRRSHGDAGRAGCPAGPARPGCRAPGVARDTPRP